MLVIYDFDGTLVDTLPVCLRAYKNALARLGVMVSDDDVIKKCFNRHENVEKEFGVTGFSKIYKEELHKEYSSARYFSGALETISKLRSKGVKVAIGSANRLENVKLLLKDGYFDAIETNENQESKTEIFTRIQNQFEPQKTIVVGDGPNDIQAAKELGMIAVQFYTKEHERYYPKFDAVQIKSHEEILEFKN